MEWIKKSLDEYCHSRKKERGYVVMLQYIIGFSIAFVVSLLTIPLVIKFSKRFGFVDQPNYRKVHKDVMPRLGGLSIIIGTTVGALIVVPNIPYMTHIVIGAAILILTGILDDKYNLSAKVKITSQLVAATVVVSSGLNKAIIKIVVTTMVDTPPAKPSRPSIKFIEFTIATIQMIVTM